MRKLFFEAVENVQKFSALLNSHMKLARLKEVLHPSLGTLKPARKLMQVPSTSFICTNTSHKQVSSGRICIPPACYLVTVTEFVESGRLRGSKWWLSNQCKEGAEKKMERNRKFLKSNIDSLLVTSSSFLAGGGDELWT